MEADPIQRLATHAATQTDAGIPGEVLDTARILFEDTVACILAGSTAEGVRAVRRGMRLWGGSAQATILGFGDRTAAPAAAFVNAVMGHARDFDDTHDPAVNHGCVTIVPALLAVTEFLGSRQRPDIRERPPRPVSGRAFLAALAVGLDVSNRLGMGFIDYLHTGWLPTTLWGPFGCAAACARLLGLDAAHMGAAFGLAYATCHGNRQALVDGALAKRVQPAFSTQAGLQAAFLAAEGITAARRVLGGAFGLPALYTSGRVDLERITGELGRTFETSRISLKPYPSCRCTHAVIDAARRLRDGHGIAWRDIEKGEIYLPPQSMGQIGHPFRLRTNPVVDAQFSAPYTAAFALVRGAVSLADFTEEAIRGRTHVLDTAARFTPIEFEQGRSGLVPVELVVTCRDGCTARVRIDHPRGSPETPMTEADRAAKFNDCLDHAVRAFSDAQRKALLSTLRTLHEADDVAAALRPHVRADEPENR